jgi:hypothetical protein
MTALVVVEAVLLAVLTVLVAGLLRAYADVLRRLRALDGGGALDAAGHGAVGQDGPAPFRVAPGLPEPAASADGADWPEAHDISGVGPDGAVIALRTVGVAHDTALLFLSSGCSSCATFWDELRRPLAVGPSVRVVVVTRGAEHEDTAEIAGLAPPGVDVVLSTQAWRDYGVPGSPYVVLVAGATGRVRGEGTGQSWQQVSALLSRADGGAADRGAPAGRSHGGKPRADRERESDVDRELLAAGILPGDPSLYQVQD